MSIMRVVPNLPVADLGRAKKFYTDKLGFKVVRDDPSPGASLERENWRIYLYKGSPTQGARPAVGLVVDNVESTMDDLRSKGVVFNDIVMFNIMSVNGLFSMDGYKMAAFRDSEGNTLSISNA